MKKTLHNPLFKYLSVLTKETTTKKTKTKKSLLAHLSFVILLTSAVNGYFTDKNVQTKAIVNSSVSL